MLQSPYFDINRPSLFSKLFFDASGQTAAVAESTQRPQVLGGDPAVFVRSLHATLRKWPRRAAVAGDVQGVLRNRVRRRNRS